MPSAEGDRHVIVVGGGITGLATASALQSRGIAASVLERRDAGAEAGFAINLPGNAIAALSRLGFGPEIEAVGSPIKRREYRAENGRLLLSVNEALFWAGYSQSRALRRSDLLRILEAGVATGTILHGHAVETVEQDPGEVRAMLEGGGTIAGALLVGADGVGSRIRRHVEGADAATATLLGEASWRFMVPNPGVDCWTLWSGAEALVLLLPVGEQAYGWATLRRDGSRPDPALLHAASARFPGPVRVAIECALACPGALHHSTLREVSTSRWHSGRLLVVGDAAHATAPVWAQGAAMGLEDAVVLAEELAVHRDWTVALAAYEQRRRPRVAHVQAATVRMARASKLPVWLRNSVTSLFGERTYRYAYEPLRSPA